MRLRGTCLDPFLALALSYVPFPSEREGERRVESTWDGREEQRTRDEIDHRKDERREE